MYLSYQLFSISVSVVGNRAKLFIGELRKNDSNDTLDFGIALARLLPMLAKYLLNSSAIFWLSVIFLLAKFIVVGKEQAFFLFVDIICLIPFHVSLILFVLETK